MKNSIIYYLVVLLIVASCKEQPKEIKAEKNNSEVVTEDPFLDISCYSSEKIYPETATIWEQSWVSYEKAKSNSIYSNSTSPEIHFSKDSLETLMSGTSKNKGILVYYILENITDPIPSLAIIQTDNCNSNLNTCSSNCVLVSWYGGKEEFRTIEDFNGWKENWKNKRAPVFRHTPVYAYNYQWSLIESLLSSNKVNDGIIIKYGVRTLGVQEYKEFTNNMEIINGPVGSAVYCNILIGVEGEQAFYDVSAVEYDFAKPCPAYCNQ